MHVDERVAGRRSRVACRLVLLALLGCGAHNPDPRQMSIEDVQRSGLGAWTQVTTIYGVLVEGELIAVDDGAVRILPRGSNAVVSLTKQEIAEGTLYRYTADASSFSGWGVLGTVSTLSHGFWLVFSAPIWILWSGITTTSENNHVVLEMKPGAENWANVSMWARFPQGMPRGFAQPPPGAVQPARPGAP